MFSSKQTRGSRSVAVTAAIPAQIQPFPSWCYPREHVQTGSCLCCYPLTCSLRASSSSCAGALTPGSSPPARRWGRSAGGPSAGTHNMIHIRHSRDSETTAPSEHLCSPSGSSSLRSSPARAGDTGHSYSRWGQSLAPRASHTHRSRPRPTGEPRPGCGPGTRSDAQDSLSAAGEGKNGDKALERRAFLPEEEDKAPSSSGSGMPRSLSAVGNR